MRSKLIKPSSHYLRLPSHFGTKSSVTASAIRYYHRHHVSQSRGKRYFGCANGSDELNNQTKSCNRIIQHHQHKFLSYTAAATEDTISSSTDNPSSCSYHVQVAESGKTIQISFPTSSQTKEADDKNDAATTISTFHAAWLWSNDPSNIHPTSGQRLNSPGAYDGSIIMSASVVNASEVIGVDRQNGEDDGVVLPIPPPPPGCCHSIGTVYSSSIPDDGKETTSNQELLRIEWSNGENIDSTNTIQSKNVSYYDLKWLKGWRYDSNALYKRRIKTEVTPSVAIRAIQRYENRNEENDTRSKRGHDGLVHVNYNDIMEGNGADELLRLFEAIFSDGAAIIRNTPQPPISTDTADVGDSEMPVAKVGRTLGGGSLSHGSLYGDIFHVKSIPDAHNVAYTSLSLAPHQDLAYYESIPGLQLLHCVEMGKNIVVGESVLIDAMAAAYRLRQLAPNYFKTLVDCPTLFVKQRDGACMTYQRPCIRLAAQGGGISGKNDPRNFEDYMYEEIVSVNWSPPFEGPLCIHPDRVEEYYEAYAAFERMLDTSISATPNYDDMDEFSQYGFDYTWERRLEPGEILVFNNQRLLHGRRGFHLKATVRGSNDDCESNRHLVGAYTNIDDTLNTYRTLLRENDPTVEHCIRNVGNGTSIAP